MHPDNLHATGQRPGGSKPKLSNGKPGHLMKRVSRACLHCRQRKSKCELDSSGHPGTPPCQRCVRDGRECVLGSSNRGGRRIRKNKMLSAATNPTSANTGAAQAQSVGLGLSAPAMNHESNNNNNYSESHSFATPYPDPNHAGHTDQGEASRMDDDDTASTADSAIGAAVPCNPSDMWQDLSKVAKYRGEGSTAAATGDSYYRSASGDVVHGNGTHGTGTHNYLGSSGLDSYRPVQNGFLSRETVSNLVSRYAQRFHPYLPLVPSRHFDPAALDAFATSEKHLLTAVLTVASKDLVNMPRVHEVCATYMVDLISAISRGGECDVDAVEALLIIAEWEPQGLLPRIEEVGRGDEDRAAWMHVGIAIRAGYFLGLDKTSFRDDATAESESYKRKRLAWTCCYISDRLISVRIGRAFWSRGPGPTADFEAGDFPSLKSEASTDDDYAKILLATMKLTQLYGNVHEVLYTGMRTSYQRMLTGDYVKYVDDFRKDIRHWYDKWKTLNCSLHVKATLKMSCEYLRLYTNAFAFQAAITQALANKPESDAHTQRDHLRAKFSSVASMPDARFIYDSVHAAESYLDIVNEQIDPEEHLRYMPLRYYLYSIYAAVFLYKARSFGVVSEQQEFDIRQKVAQTMDRLRKASVSKEDIGYRYARLLDLLWKPKPSPSTATSTKRQRQSTDISLTALTNPLPEPDYMHFSPANGFSWLDLEGVRDFISRDMMPSESVMGMAPSYQQGQGPVSYFNDPQGGLSNWLFDPNGNLLF